MPLDQSTGKGNATRTVNYYLFYLQLVGTALLVSCVFAIVDKNNNAPDKGSAPVLIGLVVFVIGATFGFNCGYAINPARDLGPRIFTAMAGWGGEVFTYVSFCIKNHNHPQYFALLSKNLRFKDFNL